MENIKIKNVSFEQISSLSTLSLLGFTMMVKENKIIKTVYRKDVLKDFRYNYYSFTVNSHKFGTLKALVKRVCSASQLLKQGIEPYDPMIFVTYFKDYNYFPFKNLTVVFFLLGG